MSASSLSLRPYQARALDVLRERHRAGSRAPLLVSPTGSGKTILEAEIARLHLERSPTHRVLAIAHRRELVLQIAETFRRAGLDVGEIRPDAEPRDARVQVASTQTLLARGEVPVATLELYDEAHHYSADDWSRLTQANPNALRCGFSATPARSDGRGLSPPFDSLVEVATIKELTKDGFLVPCRVIAPDRALSRRQLVSSPLEAYLEHAEERPTIVFTELVSDAEAFAAEFHAAGIEAVVVHGDLATKDRDAAVRAHRETGAVLINCMCLTEGFDNPSTSVCILARGCGSVGTYLQIGGRVLRPAPGKSEAVLIDLTGRSYEAHGAIDEERVFSLTGKGIRRKDRCFGKTCAQCGSLVETFPCDVCRYEPEHVEIAAMKIVGGTLAEKFADKRAEDIEKRIETLSRWIAEAKAKGHKPWSVIYRFKNVYGYRPDQGLYDAARDRAQAISCATCTSCERPTAKTYRGGQCGRCAFEQKGAA